MKKIFTVLIMLVLVAGSAQAAMSFGAANYLKNIQYVGSSDADVNPIAKFMQEADTAISLGLTSTTIGTGSVFYVDSGATQGAGTSWSTAKNTLAAAIALCTSNNGDVIMVAAGHAENIASAGAITCDKIGVKIICLGQGTNRPTFTWTAADGTLIVSAANVSISNARFVAGISAVAVGISVAAGGDDFTLYNCEFVNPATATYEFYDMVALAVGADRVSIIGNKFISTVTTTGCVQAIDVDAGIVDRLTIVGNEFQGNFSVAAIHSNKVNTNAVIGWNIVKQDASGQFAIEFTDATTGICVGNSLYTDAYATCLDPGSLKCVENYAVNAIDLSAVRIPPVPAIATVTAGSAEDILAKLYYTSDGAGAYPATAANDSTISKILAKGSTATASTFDNSTDSLEAISDAVRTAFPAYTNPNYLLVRAPTAGNFDTTGTWSTVAKHELLTVTGCVRILIIAECGGSVSSVGDTGTIQLGDETNTASVIAASTLGSGAMATGELWVDATLTRTILTQTQLNAVTFVVCAGKDVGYEVATNALSGGFMNFHVWWVPLDATGAVVAGAGGTL